ncbi:MAG: DUF5623 domain-containing protein [Aquabacterium sp.]|nr:DUF5623 domain-containing protein [Aquabacterium sp.]
MNYEAWQALQVCDALVSVRDWPLSRSLTFSAALAKVRFRRRQRDLRMAIGSAEYRPGVREKLDRVRSELDDWVQMEYDRQELDIEHFSAMYYGALGTPFRRSPTVAERSALLAAIGPVREQLARHYPDCAPRRRLHQLVNQAERSAQSWQVDTPSSSSITG